MRQMLQQILGDRHSRRRQLFHRALGPNTSRRREVLETVLGRRSYRPKTAQSLSKLMEIKLDERGGLDIGHLPIAGTKPPLDDRHGYWAGRKNDRIYFMTVLYAHLFCRDKGTVADIGCHSSPLVLMLADFEKRFAIDPSPESREFWKDVDGATYINDVLSSGGLPRPRLRTGQDGGRT
jgi:hypothetical protein